MLSDQEQRSWDEIERRAVRDSRRSDGLRALTVGAVAIGLMLAMVGAVWLGLAVLVVPVLAWLWRYWRALGTACSAVLIPMDGWVAADRDERIERRTR